MQVITLSRPSHSEVFITAATVAGESAEKMLGRIAGVIDDIGARIVSQELFGFSGDGDMRMLSEAFGSVCWPVTCVEQDCAPAQGVGGTQLWAVTGVPVEPLELEGRIVGSLFEDDFARYCRLGGLVPRDTSRSRDEQTREVLEYMETALHAAGLEFSHVPRTWFYNDDILSWYDNFNDVRDTFFRDKRVFDGLVPASTGVGARPAAGTALVGGLLAVKAKQPAVRAVAVPSPLQCPALEYGSSFSRAVELSLPDHRRLFVSGTASIAPEGHTVHAGDVDAQIALSMDVVHAILESCGMSWADVVRGIAYFKQAEDAPAFGRYCARRQLAPMPVLSAHTAICRADLLFELEVDAVAAT